MQPARNTRPEASLVVPLHELADLGPEIVGGKAHSLGVLAEAGFRVPNTVVLTTTALQIFLADAGLRPPSSSASDDELESFRQQITSSALPSSFRLLLEQARSSHLGRGALAIRSSGTSEDLRDASFAGQYETYLNVQGTEKLEDAVKACWASLWKPGIYEYARTKGVTLEPRMAVIVQDLVLADTAGVTFTVNPMTGREEECLVEAVFGLGEPLVSGRAPADRYVLGIESGEVIESEIANKTNRALPTDEGIELVPVPLEESETPALTHSDLSEMARFAGDVQEHYGQPMDIEWAYSKGELFALQARPITQISFSPDLGEWTTADLRDGGVSSTVCSPFMWSLYDYIFEYSMPVYFKGLRLTPAKRQATWARMFFGRPYWNLAEVKRAMENVPGYSEDTLHADLGVDVDEGYRGKRTPVTLRGLLRALPTLVALKKSYRERLAYNREFAAAFDERKRPFDVRPREIAALDDKTFTARYRSLIQDFYFDTETAYFLTVYNTSNSKLDFTPVLERVNALADNSLDAPTLLAGLVDLSHLKPIKDMNRLVADLISTGAGLDDEKVADFAWRWRHHGRRELDVRVPRWPEDLEFVRQMLESAMETYDADKTPEVLEKELYRRYENMRDEGLKAARFRPLLQSSFRKKLELVRQYAWWREEMRDYSTFVHALIRLWSLEAANRLVAASILDESDDLWHLHWPDVMSALEGEMDASDVRRRVRRGRRLVQSFRNFDNPNEIGTHFRRMHEKDSSSNGEELRGTPCSPGRVVGRARVVHSLEEGARLEKGDVLVTVFTDPAWTPLFPSLGGVVTETGGVLSHAAVISREYGIPAVLGVSRATNRIADGDPIVLDGRQGVVMVLEKQPIKSIDES